MIPCDPTGEEVVALAAHLGERYCFRVERKSHSEIMALCGRVLEALGIQSQAAFLGSYATTLPALDGPGSVVYLPGDLGQDGWWSLRSQHDVLVHEAVHALQYQREGAIYACRYLVSEEERAMLECQAYGTRYELAWLRGEDEPDPALVAEHLRSYACSPATIEAAAVALRSWAATAREGGLSEVGQAVAEWWRGRRG